MPAVASVLVADAFCELLVNLVTWREEEQRLQMLPHAMPLLRAVFSAGCSTACLKAVGAVADFVVTDRSTVAMQLQPLYDVADGMLQAVLTSTTAASERIDEDTKAAALGLVSCLARLHPYHALQEHPLSTGVQLCMKALRCRERTAVEAAAPALLHILAPSVTQQACIREQGAPLNALQHVLQHTQGIVQDVLVCLCRISSHESWTPLARLLFALTCAHGQAAAHVLHDALMVAKAECILDTRLTQEDCEKVAHLVMTVNFAERRFCALIIDFASIAHGMASSDVLVAYEVPVPRSKDVIVLE
jgi:hypothetical protein